MISDATPPVFDVVGGTLAVSACLLSYGVLMTPRQHVENKNFHRMVSAAASGALSIYTAAYLSDGMGGLRRLLGFVATVNDGRHGWTVWLTLAVWLAVTLYGVGLGLTLMDRPFGPRIERPALRYIIVAGIFAALWWADAFFPVSRTDASLWALQRGANFFLQCLYLGGITQGVTAILLWCKPTTNPAWLAEQERQRRGFTLRPSGRR